MEMKITRWFFTLAAVILLLTAAANSINLNQANAKFFGNAIH